VEYHFSRTFRRILRGTDLAEIEKAWNTLSAQATEQLAVDGFTGKRAQLKRFAALHYKGQTYELVVPVIDGPIDIRMVSYLEEAFGAEHERTYGHRAGLDEPVELVSIQVVGVGLRLSGGVPQRVIVSRPEPAPAPPRPVYFGKERGWIETPVLRRSGLTACAGPLIVEEYDSTCVIPPDARAELDAGGNIVVEL
jgi:N-methylhydantoinase A